jgi:carboxylesterase
MLIRAALALAAVAFAVLGFWRRTHLRAMAEAAHGHRRFGADGVVIGGEGFVFARPSAPAVLLLHGGGDTPQTLRYLGESLYANGFHVSAPLLPGHGRNIRDFMRVTADELSLAARSSYAELKATHEWVGVIGLSMGGALAVQLAANDPTVSALGLAAPYLAMPPRIARAARLAWLWGTMIPVVRSSDGVSLLDPDEREKNLAYGVFSAAGLRALRITVQRAAAAAPLVAAPVLVVQSTRDNRISVAAAERAFARLGSREKRLAWVSHGAHVITADYGRDEVITLLTDWMRTHRAGERLSQ